MEDIANDVNKKLPKVSLDIWYSVEASDFGMDTDYSDEDTGWDWVKEGMETAGMQILESNGYHPESTVECHISAANGETSGRFDITAITDDTDDADYDADYEDADYDADYEDDDDDADDPPFTLKDIETLMWDNL